MWISPWTQARTGKAPHPKPHSFRFLQFSMLKVSTKCAQLGKSLAPEKPGINISERDYKIFRLLPASTNWNASKQDRLRVGHGSMSCVVLWYDDSELSSTLHFGRQLSAQLASDLLPIAPLVATKHENVNEGCSDMCESRHNLCFVGSRCINHYGGISCDCFGTHYEGEHCDIYSEYLSVTISIFLMFN